jgi:metal-dependent amidase/aminoacylase/carboxypeptidase family protein
VDTNTSAGLATLGAVVDEVVATVHSTPELAYEEAETAAYLIERLESLGARVTPALAGLPTCFRAELGPEEGPGVGVVVPLDAVPIHVAGTESTGINTVKPVHACGHSVIAGAAVGAIHLLRASPSPLPGRLVVMGIPADEIHGPAVRARGGGKAVTAKAGVWDDLDAVIYAHPEFLDTVWMLSRWMTRRRIRLHGPRSFAAGSRDVLSATVTLLDGCMGLVNRYGAEWVVLEAASFEGDVEDGSPCGAEMNVLIFGHDKGEVEQRVAELVNVAMQACAGTGLTPEVSGGSSDYEGVLPNTVLQSVIASVFGASYVPAPGELPFATDFGNLSRCAPSAQVGIGRAGGWHFHTEDGAKEFASPDGRAIAARLARVLASTVLMLTSNPEILKRAREEFEARLAERGRSSR